MANKKLISEIRRMQQLAGIISENENMQADPNQIKKAAEKVANDPKVQDKVEDIISNLSPDKLNQLEKDILNTIEKLKNQPDLTTENDENKAEKAADAIESAASGLVASLLIPVIPVAIGSVVGGVALGFGAFGLGIAGLYGLASLIRKFKNNNPQESNSLNENWYNVKKWDDAGQKYTNYMGGNIDILKQQPKYKYKEVVKIKAYNKEYIAQIIGIFVNKETLEYLYGVRLFTDPSIPTSTTSLDKIEEADIIEKLTEIPDNIKNNPKFEK